MRTLSENDKKTQKTWLNITLGWAIGLPLLVLIMIFFNLGCAWWLSPEPIDFLELVEASHKEWIFPISLMLRGSFFTYLHHYVAIKKRENWFLIIALILSPFSMLKDYTTNLESTELDQLTIAFTLLELIVAAWWYVASIRLIRMNKRLRYYNLVGTEGYRTAIDELEQSSSLDELNSRWQRITKGNKAYNYLLADLYHSRQKQVS